MMFVWNYSVENGQNMMLNILVLNLAPIEIVCTNKKNVEIHVKREFIWVAKTVVSCNLHVPVKFRYFRKIQHLVSCMAL